MSSAYNSAEFPTFVNHQSLNAHQSMNTISKEFNTQALIDNFLQTDDIRSEDLDGFLKLCATNSDGINLYFCINP